MKRSTDRILVTHQGTLPRAQDLREMVVAREDGKPVDEAQLSTRLRSAVADMVAKQRECGIDFVNDGEQSKSSFQYYARSRLSGHQFEPSSPERAQQPLVTNARDELNFPGFFDRSGGIRRSRRQSYVVEPVKYIGQAAVQQDIDNLKAAIGGTDVAGGVIMTLAPGTIEHWLHNDYYESQEEFLFAVADALHEEYQAIADSGLIVHLDDPDLADGWQIYPDMTVDEYRTYAGLRVEALNHALTGIPEDRVRYHVCFGSWHTPHTADAPLAAIVDLVLKVRAGAYAIEAANPRHEHEWRVWRDVGLPEGKILIPGVVTHHTIIVEHPELVADRIVRFAEIVGRENLIAGTDCGFAQTEKIVRVPASVMWAKLESLAEGARIASKRLWG